MRYYRMLALFVLIGLTMLAACGGSPRGFGLVGKPIITPEQSPNVTTLGISGLKPRLHFTYSLEGHPSVNGFALVALENEYTPKAIGDAPLAISVEPGSSQASPKLVLSASGQHSVLAHFRYDPTKWKVGGVYSSNCWPGTVNFLPLATIAEPGVLLLSSMPVGTAPTTGAVGTFAVIQMQPVSKTASDYADTISGTPDINGNYDDQPLRVIWLQDTALGLPIGHAEGTITYRLDGQFGDPRSNPNPNSKDGDITGAELTKSYVNNQLHNLEIGTPDNTWFGDELSTGETWNDLSLSFRETFIADYNNDGIVNTQDVSPIGQHWDWTYSYHAQRGAHESGQTAWLNLKRKYLDYLPSDTDETKRWYWSSHDVDTFWYQNHSGWTDPTDFDDSNVTLNEAANAVDGNWDGLVYDSRNWNNWETAAQLEGTYDEPANHKWHPGDLALIDEHWGENLTGYQVFIQGYAKGTTAPTFDPNSPETCGAILARNYFRTDNPNSVPPPIGPPLLPTPIPYDNNRDFAAPGKPIVSATLTYADFPEIGGAVDMAYDIYIYPYYYHENSVFRGPQTKLAGAYYWVNDPAPYFVKPSKLPSQIISEDGEPSFYAGDTRLWNESYQAGHQGGMCVYFFPAIDPPEYEQDINVEYKLYLSPITEQTPDPPTQLPVPKATLTLNYNDYYYITGEAGGIPGQRQVAEAESAYSFLVYDLPERVSYWALVTATVNGETSALQWVEVKTGGAPYDGSGQVLLSGLVYEDASVIGSLQADDDGISILYGANTGGDLDQLTLRRLMQASGSEDDSSEQQTIQLPTALLMNHAFNQLSIGFMLDSEGNIIETTADRPTPVMAGTNLAPPYSSLADELCTARRDQYLSWNFTLHNQAQTQPTFWSSEGDSLFSYAYFDPTYIGVNQNGLKKGAYFLTWVFDEYGPTFAYGDVYTNPMGELRYGVFDSEGYDDSYGHHDFWDSTNSEWFGHKLWLDLATPWFAVSQWPANSEIVLRDVGRRPTWKDQSHQPNAGNRLFVFAASPTFNYDATTTYGYSPVQSWDTMKLRSIDDPLQPSRWSPLYDVRSSLEGSQLLSETDAGGPASFAVSRTGSEYSDTHRLYVAYVNSPMGICESRYDGKGLRVATATQSGMFLDSSWSSSETDGLVDSSYFSPWVSSYYGDRGQTANDVLDLQRKPSRLYTTGVYDDLGIAYIHPDGSLYLREYSNSTWGLQQDIVSAYPDGSLATGRILWAKLLYVDDGPTPLNSADDDIYVLYAMRNDAASSDPKSVRGSIYDIRLCRIAKN